ncbi:AAA family ATPase [Burkholderia orbicola]|uniref:AAA family ATPase n=1 Tax=Burkholderia orbicola TaxID=2978683 RepID=UPI00264EB613|nr:AAA family ATPase [Burkholderia orbicola]MDN7994557.1 AAA family ATPase [Burkholderia orbicola]
MYVKNITLENYRSFQERTTVSLSPGMNLILGENNSGKSSLLESFSLANIEYEPHLSTETKQHPDDILAAPCVINMRFSIGLDEVWRYLGEAFVLPVPHQSHPITQDIPGYLAKSSKIEVGVKTTRERNNREIHFYSVYDDNEYTSATGSATLGYTCLKANGVLKGTLGGHLGGTSPFQGQTNHLLGRLYKFRAERMNNSRSMFGTSSSLSTNASNLPECLNFLQSHNPDLYEEYIKHVHQIFPSVHRVQAVPITQTELEIRTSLVPSRQRRPDLTVSLSQSGTGIGQVLAILYVAMNSATPLVIAIDEPNSFLHPKAVRTLLAILNNLPIKHQYIITTHSPEVIRAANASSVSVVVNRAGRSTVESLDLTNLDHVKTGLASIGARLSDVYGADCILWVEGETEELTFPRIATEIAKLDAVGTMMLKVSATGDFESPKKIRPKMVFDTYTNISNSGALLPPAVGFIFDRESRTQAEMRDLERDSKGAVRFLSRVCFESYILSPEAIAHVLSKSAQQAISPESIIDWINKNGNDRKFLTAEFDRGTAINLHECDSWLDIVHAPKILKEIFNDVPNNPEEYRKTTHSVEITDWLIENSPQYLQPIADLLAMILVRPH